MDNRNSNTPAEPLSGGAQIARINGAQIKRIREAKGLTQLYLSEVVGVTTDTISRWENRRYPSIKMENALRLAQALEVGVVEILEQEKEITRRNDDGPQAGREKTFKPSLLRKPAFFVILAMILAGFAYWYAIPFQETGPNVSATRILPPHVPPGQVFPVYIRVENPAGKSIVLILKETLPPGTVVETSAPSFTAYDPRSNELKWISRTGNSQAVFTYTVRAPVPAENNDRMSFQGAVTIKEAAHNLEKIQGNAEMSVLPYHWADTNQDKMIDDEEILAVYDLYSDIKGLGFDLDLIDDIWAGKGYRWDDTAGRYIALQ